MDVLEATGRRVASGGSALELSDGFFPITWFREWAVEAAKRAELEHGAPFLYASSR
ncbi:hypothetical protein GCM10022630_31200 [Thermobifida alba]